MAKTVDRRRWRSMGTRHFLFICTYTATRVDLLAGSSGRNGFTPSCPFPMAVANPPLPSPRSMREAWRVINCPFITRTLSMFSTWHSRKHCASCVLRTRGSRFHPSPVFPVPFRANGASRHHPYRNNARQLVVIYDRSGGRKKGVSRLCTSVSHFYCVSWRK